jgi:hypothetical protein
VARAAGGYDDGRTDGLAGGRRERKVNGRPPRIRVECAAVFVTENSRGLNGRDLLLTARLIKRDRDIRRYVQ